MLHQNFKQINIKNFSVSANFKKEATPKPARIPPQTPPAGGKSAEAGRIRNPRQIVSPCRVRILVVLIIWILLEIVSNFVQQTPPKLKIGIGSRNGVGTKCRHKCIPPKKS
jgi:hypothetical protein